VLFRNEYLGQCPVGGALVRWQRDQVALRAACCDRRFGGRVVRIDPCVQDVRRGQRRLDRRGLLGWQVVDEPNQSPQRSPGAFGSGRCARGERFRRIVPFFRDLLPLVAQVRQLSLSPVAFSGMPLGLGSQALGGGAGQLVHG
jgi:hypothetical protein